MPPKLKFQQKSGKFNKPLLKNSVQNNEDVPQTVLSPEEAQKFEVELCWCIQQLQIATKSGKLNQKQGTCYTSLNKIFITYVALRVLFQRN